MHDNIDLTSVRIFHIRKDSIKDSSMLCVCLDKILNQCLQHYFVPNDLNAFGKKWCSFWLHFEVKFVMLFMSF